MVAAKSGERMPDRPGLNYGRLMQKALRGLMAEVLGIVAEEGLPGEHHLYISVDTTHPGVVMADWLRARYPRELTIVLQHEFYDLAVASDRFQVRLSFSERPETLVVPFAAVLTFIDPSVKFGLKFDEDDTDEDAEFHPMSVGRLAGDETPEDAEDDGEAGAAGDTERSEDPDGDPGPRGGSADIVSLDRFRKS